MIVVFFQAPFTAPIAPPYNVFVGRAASAAAEITNTIEWLMVYS